MSSKQSSIATLLMAFGIFFCSSDLIRIEAKRSLQLEMNPGCVMDFCRNISVAYIRSFNSDSIVSERNASTSNASSSCYHFLWIFTTKYTPTIFLFESDPNARLMIDWKKFDRSRFNNITSNFIEFIDGEIQQSFGLELSQLFVRNMTTKQLIQTIPIDGLGWRSNIIKTNRSIWIKFIGDDPRIASINFELEATKLINEIDQHLPRLTLSESSNLVRLTLENININEKLENPIDHLQVCANFTTVLGGDAISNQLIVERTIDDEFTPGVFQVNRPKNFLNDLIV
ncbi:phosphatidylinositol N-acetylglucosaminyltransferase subunit P-like [Sarcoptes scabiei]|nr:phosphatidylinositol N-acetylglucosaminyltransferase subunit P-like [Sarcoptes scabiei]